MSYSRLAGIAWRWAWLLVLASIIGAMGAYVFSKREGRVYEATSTILVSQAQITASPSYNDVLANQQLAKTYSSLILRRPVLDKVEKNLDLPSGATNGQVRSILLKDTQLIEIHVQSSPPQLAADVANEVAKVFSAQIRDSQNADQTQMEKDIESRITSTQAALESVAADRNRLSQPSATLRETDRQDQLAQANSRYDGLNVSLQSLQKQRDEARAGLIRSASSITIAEPAIAPTIPIKPRVSLNTMLGAAMGLLVSFGIIVLAEYLDDTIKTSSDVSEATGLPVLGTVNRFTVARGTLGVGAPELVSNMSPRSAASEAYRMMRTNLEFAHGDRPFRTMLVTSARSGEGKSTTAANLALVLANSGRRVVLVDADMRNPSLHRMFDLGNKTGLTNLFGAEDATLEEVLRLPQDNLVVLPSGPIPPNPAEMLSSRRMEQIIAVLKEQADFVVFDCPPLNVADASALAGRVDGTIVVVEAGRTRRDALGRSIDALRQVNASVWGVVLNKVSKRQLPQPYDDYDNVVADSNLDIRQETRV